MSKNLLFALSALILLAGCHKEDESYLNKSCNSGCAVFNIRVGAGENSATPVSGVKVDLVWQGSKGIFGGGGSSIDVVKGYTDVQGVINAKFKAEGGEFTNGYFVINVTGPSNYIASSRVLGGIRNPDTTLNTSVHMPFLAHLKIIFKNYDPTGSGDAFGAMPSYDTYGSEATPPSFATVDYHNTSFFSGLHPFDSVTYTAITAGNQYTHIPVSMWRNGIHVSRMDSLYIPAGATGTYRVDYQHSFQ
ncbi:MAG TPA: hypothetical protein VHB54_08065 [Mucilaginibacter sp.]|nr:hypothetical protein [Mucilaginibacter sp.]